MDLQKSKIVLDKLIDLEKRLAYTIKTRPESVDMGKTLDLVKETRKRIKVITDYMK